MKFYISKFLFFISVLMLFVSNIYAQNSFSEKDSEAIIKIKETYRNAWLKNDSQTILSLFTDDASIFPNGLSPRKGKEELSKFWFSPSDSKTDITNYDLEIKEIIGNKKMAAASGQTKIKWTTTNKNGVAKYYQSEGNFLTVFIMDNKKWKITKHIWNGKFGEVKK